MEITSWKDLAVIIGLLTIAGTGWNLYLSSKVGSISKLWKKFDELLKQFNEYKVELARDYATKATLVHAVDEVKDSINRLADKIDELIKNR